MWMVLTAETQRHREKETMRDIGTWRRWTGIALVALSLGMGFGAGACTDDQDACREFCRMATECLGCGATADVDQCRSQCESLSIEEKKALANCAQDCANVRACPTFQAHPELNPGR